MGSDQQPPIDPPIESLKCPDCGCRRSRVLETREGRIRGYYIKMRIRLCTHCGYHYRTKEVTDDNLSFSKKPSPEPSPSENPLPVTTPLPPLTEIEITYQAPIKTVDGENGLPPNNPAKEQGKVVSKKRGRPRKYADNAKPKRASVPKPSPNPQTGLDFFPPVN